MISSARNPPRRSSSSRTGASTSITASVPRAGKKEPPSPRTPRGKRRHRRRPTFPSFSEAVALLGSEVQGKIISRWFAARYKEKEQVELLLLGKTAAERVQFMESYAKDSRVLTTAAAAARSARSKSRPMSARGTGSGDGGGFGVKRYSSTSSPRSTTHTSSSSRTRGGSGGAAAAAERRKRRSKTPARATVVVASAAKVAATEEKAPDNGKDTANGKGDGSNSNVDAGDDDADAGDDDAGDDDDDDDTRRQKIDGSSSVAPLPVQRGNSESMIESQLDGSMLDLSMLDPSVIGSNAMAENDELKAARQLRRLKAEAAKLPVIRNWIEKRSPKGLGVWQSRYIALFDYNVYYSKHEFTRDDAESITWDWQKYPIHCIPLCLVNFIKRGDKNEIIMQARDPEKGSLRDYRFRCLEMGTRDYVVHGIHAWREHYYAILQFATTSNVDISINVANPQLS